MNNARIFISCGQQQNEREIGLKIYDKFKGKYRLYFAENIHTPEGIENIFKALMKSEYFIGINFKRDSSNFGSLFVQQELAIASFLKLRLRFFQEEGIKWSGVLKYLMINPITFRDEDDLMKKIEEEIKDWNPNWTNELIITKGTIDENLVTNNNLNVRSDWYHIEIFNNNKFDIAKNCMVYISKIIQQGKTKKEFDIPSLELNWAGLADFSANIIPKTPREIDAFYIIRGDDKICFQSRPVYTNLPKFNYPKLYAGEYIIEYTILSDNFEKTQKEFYLKFGGDYKSIEFRENK